MSNLTKKEINSYAMYTLSSTVGNMLPLSYITIFITENLLISAALMGTTLLIARTLDFMVGVVAGGIVEKAKLPWGKYRSWLVILKYTAFAGCVMQFTDTTSLPVAARAVIIVIGYCLLHFSMNFTTTAQYGILASMAKTSMEDRSTLSIRGGQAMAVANILASATALPFINFLTPIVGNSNAYTIVATIFAAIMFIGATILTKVAAPYDPDQGNVSSGARVTVGDMVRSVLTNNQLLVVMFAHIFFYVGMFTFNGLMAYYFMYVLGNFLLMSVAMTITMIFSLFASIISPKIGVKLGKKNAMVVGLLVYGLGSLVIAFLGHISLVIYIVINCIMTLGMYMYTGFGVNYMLDAGEYGLYKTGKDNRAVAISMFNLQVKVGMTLGGAIVGYGLSIIGYKAGMEATPEFIKHFMLLFGGLPAILYFIGSIVMFKGYKITDEDAAWYAAENGKRMAALTEE